jgi:hypothetical protein
VSKGEFDHLIIHLEHGFLNLHGQAPFDRLADVGFDLLHGLTLGGAAGYRRHLSPEPSLFGLVNNHADSHRFIFSLIQLALLGPRPGDAARAGDNARLRAGDYADGDRRRLPDSLAHDYAQAAQRETGRRARALVASESAYASTSTGRRLFVVGQRYAVDRARIAPTQVETVAEWNWIAVERPGAHVFTAAAILLGKLATPVVPLPHS